VVFSHPGPRFLNAILKGQDECLWRTLGTMLSYTTVYNSVNDEDPLPYVNATPLAKALIKEAFRIESQVS